MDYKNLIIEKKDDIAILTFNRPKVLNALNSETLKEFECALYEIENDNECKVLILTGAGDKAFIAGADIKEMKDMNPVQAKEFSKLGHRAIGKLQEMEKPIIAAVNGYALGGGCEVAISCDFIYASKNAQFGLPEVTLGVFPGFGGTQRLIEFVGKPIAKELIFTGKFIKAEEALKLGLVNKVCEPENLMDEVIKTAKKIASNGQIAVRWAKSLINTGCDVDMKSGCKLESEMFGLIFSTNDQKEGMDAFLNKRKPQFKGE